MPCRLDSKVAIVTGAAGGLGRAYALALAEAGAAVVVNDVNAGLDGTVIPGPGPGAVVREIRARGGRALGILESVTDAGGVRRMFQEAVAAFGRVDILVNNAGIVRDRAIWNMPADDFDLVMRVHVRGTWLVSRAAARHWRERAKQEGSGVGGRIINTISGAGLLGNFGQSNYATAKAAIMGLTLTLSLELASVGVTVNAIGPGAVTRLSAGVQPGSTPREADEYGEDEWHELSPAVSSPVVAWLASDEARFVSGQCIRAMRTKLHLMEGWTEARTIDNGAKPWDAATLGRRMETEIFSSRASGLTLFG